KHDVIGIDIVLEEDQRAVQVVAGVVIDDRGSLIEGAPVRFLSGTALNTVEVGKEVSSGAQGHFSADIVTSGRFVVAARKGGYANAVITVEGLNTNNLIMNLARYGRITGKIVELDDRPLWHRGTVSVKSIKGSSSIVDRVLFHRKGD